MSSVTQVVNQIIESLSEAVSGLTLMVIQHKEKNSLMPQPLPGAIEGVGKAATVFTGVARQLSNSEYSKYPRIKKKIDSAADDVDAATLTIIGAVKTLSTATDRKSGWDGLAQGCKGIAGKTTTLLEIVYGAEVKRFFEIGEEASEALEKTKARLKFAETDGQGLADNASNAATLLNQMAVWATALSKEQESPFLKSQLEKKGVELQNQSDEVIRKVNAVLQDPSNEALQKDAAKQIDSAILSISSATDPLKSEMQEGIRTATRDDAQAMQSAKKLMQKLKELEELAQKIKANPNDAQLRQKWKDLLDEIQEESRALATSQPDNPLIQALKKQIDQVIASLGITADGYIDLNGLGLAANNLAGLIAKMSGLAQKDINNRTGEGASSDEMDKILQGLEAFVKNSQGKEINKKDLDFLLAQLDKMNVATPKPKPAVNKVQDPPVSVVSDSLEGVANALAEASKRANKNRNEKTKHLIDDCQKVSEELKKFAEACKSGNGSQILISAREIASLINTINQNIKELQAKVKDPKTQDRLVKMSQALRNYSIQLKILASVHASSNQHSKTEDNKLVTLGKNLGNVLTETMNTIEIGAITLQ